MVKGIVIALMILTGSAMPAEKPSDDAGPKVDKLAKVKKEKCPFRVDPNEPLDPHPSPLAQPDFYTWERLQELKEICK